MPFPWRQDGVITYPTMGEGWVHQVELAAALELYGPGAIEVLDGWVYRVRCEHSPFAWVDALAAERLRFKAEHDPRAIPLKYGLNAGYGMLARGQLQRSKVPPFLNYFWAASITAHTRAMMLRAAHPIRHELVAIATDGLFAKTKPDVVYGTGLGTWEDAGVFAQAIVIQPGVLVTPHELVRKTRGFARGALTYDQALSALLSPTERLVVHERRFVGMGACVGHGDFRPWRRWVEQERTIRFTPYPRKYPAVERTVSSEREFRADVEEALYREGARKERLGLYRELRRSILSQGGVRPTPDYPAVDIPLFVRRHRGMAPDDMASQGWLMDRLGHDGSADGLLEALRRLELEAHAARVVGPKGPAVPDAPAWKVLPPEGTVALGDPYRPKDMLDPVDPEAWMEYIESLEQPDAA